MPVFRLPKIESSRYHVYALFCQDEDGPGYVKFGMSKNIGSRITSLRGACPIPAKMIAILHIGPSRDRAVEVEKAIHARFQSRKLKGEWFKFDFSGKEDKADFNQGCREVLLLEFGREHPWWEMMSIKALDEYDKRRRSAFLNSKNRKSIERKARYRGRQRKAWRELG